MLHCNITRLRLGYGADTVTYLIDKLEILIC